MILPCTDFFAFFVLLRANRWLCNVFHCPMSRGKIAFYNYSTELIMILKSGVNNIDLIL